ncbi:MAG: hypothetical protein IKY83_01570 [Proteobacteria bacterium]|nr:hypothetical protein [Pseudomonadota bacterium]
MRIKAIWVYSLVVAFGFSLFACSDEKSNQITVPIEDEPSGPGTDPEDPFLDPDPGDPYDPSDPIVEPEAGWEAVLLPGVATDIELANKGTTKLSVNLISISGDHVGEGIVGQTIQWGLETGEQSVQLASNKSTTKEGGQATLAIRGLGVPGNATVVAASKIAPKQVRFQVAVQDLPTGSLEFRTMYNGNASPVNYVIKLYDGSEVSCARMDLKHEAVMNWRTETEAEPILEPVDSNYAKFSDLSVEMKYAAVAYGFSEKGAPVAVGCLDSGIDVYANQTTSGTIYMDTIDLNPVTTYHVRSYFDLGDVVSELGSVGKFINMIGNFADDPAGMVYKYLFKYLKESIGLVATAVEWALNKFNLSTKLTNLLNGMIGDDATMAKIGLFACQFRDIVRLMEFMGEIQIEKTGQIELRGTDAYDGFAVYWRIGCSGSNDSNCGRIPITSKELGLNSAINFLEGTWEGSLSNGYDKVSIENHELKLYYGKILIHLLNEVVIPRISNNQAHDFNSLFGYWIKADSIAQWISQNFKWSGVFGTGWGAFSFTFEEARGFVDSVMGIMSGVFGFATAELELKSAGSEIILSGTGYLEDTNADNVVDIIRDGKWAGSMQITTKTNVEDDDGHLTQTSISTTTAVKGIWSGYNLKNVSDSDSRMYCTYDKLPTDSNDQVCSYPKINTSELVSSNMCQKYYATAGL